MKDFNVEKVTNEIIEFIREYYKKNNLKGVVLGISAESILRAAADVMQYWYAGPK